ncbi:MAG: hypothetical protein K2W96_17060 [Gemmataceae bacterium]|nr:hypothetical protein [Gemmataceae bacterium]
MMMTALVMVAMLADAEPPAKPVKTREITAVKRLVTELGGDPMKPVRLKSEKELADAVGDEAAKAILKEVDFKKEHLLLFAWAGSGGDRIEPTDSKRGDAAFAYTRGKRKDLRKHAKLFAIDAKSEVKVATTP